VNEYQIMTSSSQRGDMLSVSLRNIMEGRSNYHKICKKKITKVYQVSGQKRSSLVVLLNLCKKNYLIAYIVYLSSYLFSGS